MVITSAAHVNGQVPRTHGKGKFRPAANEAGVNRAARKHVPQLIISVGEVRREISGQDLVDDKVLWGLRTLCENSTELVLVSLNDLLAFDDTQRWYTLDFIAGLPRCQVRVGQNDHLNLFDAVLALLPDTSDMTRFRRGKLAALEAAVILFSDALEGACDRVRDRLRELKVTGIRTADLQREAPRSKNN